jgi:DNA-directed RNA polymerase specialized sigma24 family protein
MQSPAMPTSVFTERDLHSIQSSVGRRSPGILNFHDREDLVGDILVDAVAASNRAGLPLAPLAGLGATRPRYYERAGRQAAARQAQLIIDTGQPDDGRDADEREDRRQRQVHAIDRSTSIENMHQLQDLIDQLPADQRAAFIACDVDHYTLEEVSAATGDPTSTIHDRLMKARAAFRTSCLAA